MEAVTMVLGLLLAVVVSAFLARLLPLRIPLPLLQIAIGACLHGAGFEVAFDSHLILLLFIPPLLFLDGWRIPKGAFFRDARSILALAIGLVVFTVLGVGVFAHWLLPAMPLAVAFALAAILSPTDPVAVGAMTAGAPLPSRLTHILEGEALLNDATGLVCFSFAVTAAETGRFSLTGAALRFALVAGGGLLVGIAATAIIVRLNRLLVRRTGEEPATQILISLLIPFAAYLAGEALHVSGILAAAVAGIAAHHAELAGHGTAATRMQRFAVWNTVQSALNGVIFILLGEHLPPVLRGLPDAVEGVGVAHAGHLLGYAAAITLALGALRFAWVWLWVRVTSLWAARRGEVRAAPPLRLVAVMATAGVRGAVTLAGILTLPALTSVGAPFPARDAAISLATGVILLSLLLASVGLPWLMRGSVAELPDAGRRGGEAAARVAAAEAGLRRIEEVVSAQRSEVEAAAAYDAASLRLIEAYQRRLDSGGPAEDATEAGRLAEAARMLRLEGLAAERDELYRLRRSGAIDDDVHRQLVREIDLVETSLLPSTRAGA